MDSALSQKTVELNCIILLMTDYAHHNRILSSSFYIFFSSCNRGLHWSIYILSDYIFAVPITISLDNNATLISFR